MKLRASVEFYWRDLWVGLYLPKPVKGGPWTCRHIYVCVIPMFPLHVVAVYK